MELVDSHCHLNFSELEKDLDKVIERAKSAGVTKIINICTNLYEAQEVYDIAAKFDNVYAAIGIHPHDASEAIEKNGEQGIYDTLLKYVDRPKTVALGETGLDLYYENSCQEDQIKNFEVHLKLAKEQDLPVVVHSRKAESQTIELLKKYQVRGVLHCFTSSYKMAKEALDLGFYISASGIVTFKNASELQETFAKIPKDRVLIETDAPFLAPTPFRGKTNEPSFLKHTLEALCSIMGVEKAILAQQTFANTHKLFTRMGEKHEQL